MTGFAALPVAEEEGQDENVQLVGTSKILGTRWLQLPTITVGLLGVQMLWSIEMSYGACCSNWHKGPHVISFSLL